MSKEKSCSTCGFFAELKEPFERSDGAVIYGYCFKDGDKDYSPNMGKGYPVFVDGGGGACKQYKRHRVAIRDQLATNCHQLETVTNRNGLNCWISVEDRLPEEAGKCIVHDVVLGVQVYFYHPDMVCSNWRSVTHWMPLPEPPEVDAT